MWILHIVDQTKRIARNILTVVAPFDSGDNQQRRHAIRLTPLLKAALLLLWNANCLKAVFLQNRLAGG